MRIYLSTVVLIGCASNPAPAAKGGPRGLRATDHLELASMHDDLAHEAATYPDVRGNPSGSITVPWVRSWNTSEDHQRIARIHRSEAATLQAAFDEACGALTPDQIPKSPLQRYSVGGSPTDTGYTFFLASDAGPPDRLLSEMRCHRAWMMLAPANMEDCPLDLPDLKVEAHGEAEGITVTLAIKPSLVTELQRRAMHDLESSEVARGHGAQP